MPDTPGIVRQSSSDGDSQTMSQDRDARFRATVYAMNSLLLKYGAYPFHEFQEMFKQGMEREDAHSRRSEAVLSEDKAKLGSK